MNQLANAFSVLELDVADERMTTAVAADHRENANGRGYTAYKSAIFIHFFCVLCISPPYTQPRLN